MVGSYGVIQNRSMPWMNMKTKQVTKKKGSSLKSGHEIFQEYANMVQDQYWKNYFESASTGKFPGGGVYYRNGEIKYKHKSKIFSINVYNSGPYKIIDFLRLHLGLNSPTDLLNANNIYKNLRTKQINVQNIQWSDISDIKSLALRKMLIIDYCTEKQLEYNLTDIEKNNLKMLIYMNITNDSINNSTIQMVDGFIKNITNLVWNPINRFFNINVHAPRSNTRNGQSKEILEIDRSILNPNYKPFNNVGTINLLTSWEKYLKKLDKNTIGTSPKNIYSTGRMSTSLTNSTTTNSSTPSIISSNNIEQPRFYITTEFQP